MAKVLIIEQIKSEIKLTPRLKDTLRAMGLHGMGTKVVRKDLRAIRGMLNKLHNVIRAEQVDENQAVLTKAKSGRKSYKIAK